MIPQLITDLSRQGAVDGYSITVQDGEVMGDGQGGLFRWSATDVQDGDTPGVGANVVKIPGFATGSWLRQPDNNEAIQTDIQGLKNSLAGVSIAGISNKINGALGAAVKITGIMPTATANITMLKGGLFYNLGAITANRTATVPDPAKNGGKYLPVLVSSTAAFSWLISGTVKRPNGVALTTFDNGRFYLLFSDKTQWIVVNNVPVKPPAPAQPTAGQTVNLVLNTVNTIDTTASYTMNYPSGINDGDWIAVEFLQQPGTITYTGATVYQPEGGSAKKYRHHVWYSSRWN